MNLVRILRQVKDALESVTQPHSCNIEYGNDTGKENCSKCKVLNALKLLEGIGR